LHKIIIPHCFYRKGAQNHLSLGGYAQLNCGYYSVPIDKITNIYIEFCMKRIVIFLLLFTSLTTFAHEDTYMAIEKSNVHIKVRVGYKTSLNVSIIESYAEIINTFIREIDPTEKVFIQFEEDYCFSNYDLVLVAYDEFKKFLIPSGFPFRYKYDMSYINTQKGVNIIIAQKYFKLEPLLKLLEFGLKNKDYALAKGKNFFDTEQSLHNPKATITIDSVMQSESSHLTKKYLSKKLELKNPPNLLTQKNINIFLQHDSIFFVHTNGTEILKLETLYSINYDNSTDCLFILDSNRSFYFINQNLKSNQKQYDFTFKLSCSDKLTITYSEKDAKYKLRKGGRTIIVVDENGNEINADWVYFDEANGVTRKE